MKALITKVSLAILIVLVLVYGAFQLQRFKSSQDLSVTAWRAAVGYQGPICQPLPSGKQCQHGVAYTVVSVNAENGFELWHACQQLPENEPLCQTK